MIHLDRHRYNEVYQFYLTTPFFFPLIASVLRGEQDGVVYVDNPASPSQIYVEHAFGFAQLFGAVVDDFEHALARYLLVDRCFHAAKVRLYAPRPPAFLLLAEYQLLCSYRQRFVMPDCYSSKELASPAYVIVRSVNSMNVAAIEEQFGLVSRFWRNGSDFVVRSHAVVVYYKEEPASLCYAAAEASNCVEIDVLTLPAYQHLGLAKLAVNHFISQCRNLSLQPLWDCFTNNVSSMRLCQSVGFSALNEPYPFFTIPKF